MSEMKLLRAVSYGMIGVLAGGLAHDFNNLLFITLGYLQMLERQPIVANDDQASTFVSRAVEAVERGATVAKSLLSFARSQPLEASAINMHSFLADLRPLVDQAIHGAHDLHLDVQGDGLDVVVDPGRPSSGLLNIVFNARDAMDHKGSITIRVTRGEATTSDGVVREMVAITVTDTGKGMSPEVAARAFEPFFTTKQRGQGTGLGLSMAFGYANQIGGHIKIYSEAGQGTTVRMYLPRARDAEDVETDIEPGPATGGTETVLVVDDAPETLALLTDALRALLLEWACYRTRAFEFISGDHTAKNLMIAAVKTGGELVLYERHVQKLAAEIVREAKREPR